MRCALLPSAVLLAVLTALALLGAAVAVRPPGVPPEADGLREARNRQTALRFYDATNHAIATGDLAPLEALVGPDLLADGSGPAPTQAGLARRLIALHATAPTLRLTATALAADGDHVVAKVEVERAEPVAVLGLRLLDPPPPWGPVDVLWLTDGRIVAYDGGVADEVLLEAALVLPWRLPAEAPHVPTVRRLALPAGTVHTTAPVAEHRLLYVAVGSLTIEVVATGRDGAPPPTVRTAGEHVMVPTGLGYAAANAGEAAAVLLEVMVSLAGDTPSPVTPGQRLSAGVPEAVVAPGPAVDLPGGRGILAVGWVTVAPGARLAWDAAGPVLLVVEAGAVRRDAAGGEAAVVGEARDATLGDAGPLVAGEVAILPAGVATLRAGTVPTTLLLVTLHPAGGPAPDADAEPPTVGDP